MKKTAIALVAFAAAVLLASSVSAGGKAHKDIVDTAVSAGSFKTLTAALQAAGLVDALRADGPFTVFAPTDEAFAKLPEGTVETLLKPENREKLRSILTYHVIKGSVASSQVKGGMKAPSLNGQDLKFTTKRGGVQVNGSNVVKADIECKNGMIHVIDKVIIPGA